MLAVKQEECETTEAAEGLAKMALSPEKLIPHPLQNSWTLWFFKVCSLHLHLSSPTCRTTRRARGRRTSARC